MMLTRILATLFLAVLAAASLYAAPSNPPPQAPFARKTNYRPSDSLPYIKVLLAKDLDNPVIEVKGKYRVYNPHDDSFLSQGYIGKKYTLQALSHGLKWGEEFPDIYQIAIVPDNDQSVLFVNDTPYRGILYVYDINGKISLVNELPIEEYVKSYLAAHLQSHLEEEAMEAVAIVARTNAYHARLNAKNPHWHVDANVVGFRGYIKPDHYSGIRQAVVATRYLVMRFKDTHGLGGILPAQWTEHCAGKTIAPSLLSTIPLPLHREGVDSPLAAIDREKTRWWVAIKKNELARLTNVTDITDVGLYTDEFSEKVYAVRIQGQSDYKDIDFVSFQEQLGPEKLKSNDFTVTIADDVVTFMGYGRGHGAGLCLYSAEKLAANGTLTPQILGKFFPNTEIVMMPTLRFTQPVPKQGSITPPLMTPSQPRAPYTSR